MKKKNAGQYSQMSRRSRRPIRSSRNRAPRAIRATPHISWRTGFLGTLERIRIAHFLRGRRGWVGASLTTQVTVANARKRAGFGEWSPGTGERRWGGSGWRCGGNDEARPGRPDRAPIRESRRLRVPGVALTTRRAPHLHQPAVPTATGAVGLVALRIPLGEVLVILLGRIEILERLDRDRHLAVELRW